MWILLQEQQASSTLNKALTKAVKMAQTEFVQWLLVAGADPDTNIMINGSPSRPLIIQAVKNREYNIMRLLIEHGCDVNKGIEEKRLNIPVKDTALYNAVCLEDLQAIEILLAAKADVTIKNDDTLQSPLFRAIEQNSVDALRTMLRAGDYVNHRDMDHDQSLLHYAVSKGNVEVVNLLLELNCDPNVIDCRYYTPLMEAIFRHKIDIIRCLATVSDINFRGQRDATALMYAAQMNEIEGLKCLLSTGAEINCMDVSGNTALIMAGPRVDIVNLLLTSRANPNLQNAFGMTALWYSAYYHYVEVVKILLRANSNADTKARSHDDQFHTSALEIALKMNYWDIAKLIILSGNTRSATLTEIMRRPDSFIPRTTNVVEEVANVLAYIRQWLCNTKSLKFWARQAIRQTIGHMTTRDRLQKLPLPEALKTYCDLQELEEEDRINHIEGI